MNASLDQIIAELRSQLAPIETEENRLRSVISELKEQRKKLEAALTVLGGGASRARPPRQSKSCATKQEVVAILTELLRANGPLARNDVEDLAKERLTDTGRSLAGFGLRLKEALREPAFSVSTTGIVSLLGPEHPRGRQSAALPLQS